jgi:hypothetical protein
MSVADIIRTFLGGDALLLSDDAGVNEVQTQLVRLLETSDEARECALLLVEFFEGGP